MKALLAILALGLLTGCANLPDLLRPQTDQQVVSADATAVASKAIVERFLDFESANRDKLSMDAQHTAKTLRETFASDSLNVDALSDLYRKNPTPENRTWLLTALAKMRAAGDVAAAHLHSYALPQGAPFAPAIQVPANELHDLRATIGSLAQQIGLLRMTNDALLHDVSQLRASQARIARQLRGTNAPPMPPSPPSP